MKKLLFFIGLVSLGIAASASTTYTYYGSKASSNTNNPCKGATNRICGTIKIDVQALSVASTLVVQTIKYADGELLSSTATVVDKPISLAVEEVLYKLEAEVRAQDE